MARVKPEVETFARIKVVGVGGGGGNAVTRMFDAQIKGVNFIAINTDAQDLHHVKAQSKLHIGKNLTRGLGAGMNPDIGRQAAEENRDEIQDVLKGADLVFITCGLGGGTGSGASSVIADAAHDVGALVVAVVTKPFHFEGTRRMVGAEEGISNLKDKVDTLLVIPNDKVLLQSDKKITLASAFWACDEVLRQAVQSITDLILFPGIINVNFADIKTIMKNSGPAFFGQGRAKGDRKVETAVNLAMRSPLLDASINGARGILFNVSGGDDLSLTEINEAANMITKDADPRARVIFGAVHDKRLPKDEIKITIIATGFEKK